MKNPKTLRLYTYRLQPDSIDTVGSTVSRAAEAFYSKSLVKLLKQNCPFTAINKRRKFPYLRSRRPSVSRDVTATMDLTWRDTYRRVSSIPSSIVYHMLFVDMGQEW